MQEERVQAQQAYAGLEADLTTQLDAAQQALEAAQAAAAEEASTLSTRWQAELDKLSAARDDQRRDYEQAEQLHERERADALARYDALVQQSRAQLEAAQAAADTERGRAVEVRLQLATSQEAGSLEKQARGVADERAAALQEQLHERAREARLHLSVLRMQH
jgi:hypothetical protein